jgi:alanine racemase
LKLQLSHSRLCDLLQGQFINQTEGSIDVVVFDTRKITSNHAGVFFALSGKHKSGHDYCEKAYKKGVRCFVVERAISLPEDCCVILVENTLQALQRLAQKHREQYSIPVLAITGSFGKTTIKEWLYFLIKDDFRVVRTPMSYNSQLGVALTLLELNDTHELAIVEADISHPGEMLRLEEMIAPTMGIFTGIGKHYASNFESEEHHLNEHLLLFKNANFTFIDELYHSAFRRRKIEAIETSVTEWKAYGIDRMNFPQSRALCLKAAEFLGIAPDLLKERIGLLPALSGRREVFEGINGNLVINDAYNIDIDALEQAMEYLMASKERTKKVVVLDLSYIEESKKNEALQLTQRFEPDQVFLIENDTLPIELTELSNAAILFKGSFRSNLKTLVKRFKQRKHETWVEFDLKAIVANLRYFQALFPAGTRTLVMVKASSYGTGDVKIPHFLQENGVDYFGVAYADEGATLRKNGIELPIMVMNTEENSFEDVVQFQLEPTIYAVDQLKRFVAFLDGTGYTGYPIHLKVETGMQRLGVSLDELDEIIHYLNESDAVRLKSVFSHLADADNEDESFSKEQIERFKAFKSAIEKRLDYADDVLFHLLNSEGLLRFAEEAAFDMVRLGIGIFGYAGNNSNLLPSIRWSTTVSQIKTLKEGESAGYNRRFIAEKPTTIATIRVGYADGFRRDLSNGKGQVFINGQPCKVVGNVCMDMTMVDVTGISCKEGDEVEIIGSHQTMRKFAQLLNTIPYEVMTAINRRVERVYINS